MRLLSLRLFSATVTVVVVMAPIGGASVVSVGAAVAALVGMAVVVLIVVAVVGVALLVVLLLLLLAVVWSGGWSCARRDARSPRGRRTACTVSCHRRKARLPSPGMPSAGFRRREESV